MIRTLVVLSCLILVGPAFAEHTTQANAKICDTHFCDEWWFADHAFGFEGWDYGYHRSTPPYPRWCGLDEFGFMVCHY